MDGDDGIATDDEVLAATAHPGSSQKLTDNNNNGKVMLLLSQDPNIMIFTTMTFYS